MIEFCFFCSFGREGQLTVKLCTDAREIEEEKREDCFDREPESRLKV